MATFVVRRILWVIPILLVVVLITFLMMRQIGGTPFRTTERAIHPAIQRNLEKKFNIDAPWYEQYALYVKGVFTWDFGPSMVRRNRTVNDIIAEHLPRSIELGLLAFTWAVLIGLPAGVLSALRHNSLFDYGAQIFAGLGSAIPSFLVGTLLIYFFALKLGDFTGLPTNGWDSWRHKILPTFALSLVPMVAIARLVRGSMRETLQQDYVRTARAKGLRHRRVITTHVLRNSLIPTVTVLGPVLGFIVTGSFVIEEIFAIPGVGRNYVESVQSRDYTTVMGLTVVLTLLIVFANLLVDLLYGFLDPRTREGRS